MPEFTPVKIGITRLGSSAGVSRVQWQTFDYSAISGIHFVAVPPTWVEFADGETHLDVTVNVIPNTSFDGAVEFGLKINKESSEGCVVGKYLHTSYVKIIDNSAFPTDMLSEWVKAGDAKKIQEINPMRLVFEFLKMCWSHPTAKTATIKTILSYQWYNFTTVLNIFLLLFVIITLTDDESSDAHKQRLLLILGALFILPFSVTHYLKRQGDFYMACFLRNHLQALLLKKFVTYEESTRSSISTEEVIMTLVRDIVCSIQQGYVATVDLVFGRFVKIFLFVVSIVYLNVLGNEGFMWQPVLAVCSLPIFIPIYLMMRQRKLFKLRQKHFQHENGCFQHVLKATINYPLIADYDQVLTQNICAFIRDLPQMTPFPGPFATMLHLPENNHG